MKAHFIIHAVMSDIVFIIDPDDGSRTVTNDAEAVVETVVRLYGDRRIVYRDTSGDWSELCHSKGIFKSFGPYDQEIPTATKS